MFEPATADSALIRAVATTSGSQSCQVSFIYIAQYHKSQALSWI